MARHLTAAAIAVVALTAGLAACTSSPAAPAEADTSASAGKAITAIRNQLVESRMAGLTEASDGYRLASAALAGNFLVPSDRDAADFTSLATARGLDSYGTSSDQLLQSGAAVCTVLRWGGFEVSDALSVLTTAGYSSAAAADLIETSRSTMCEDA